MLVSSAVFCASLANALAGNVAKFGVHHAPFVTAVGNTRTSALLVRLSQHRVILLACTYSLIL